MFEAKIDIEHKGLAMLSHLDIKALVWMSNEQEVIELITNLMSGQAEGERGEDYCHKLIEPYL